MAAAIWLEWRESNRLYAKAINERSRVTIGGKPGSDIVLADTLIPRDQAFIYFEDGNFLVRNLSKQNPILFNQRWTIAHDQIVAIQPGDSLTFGNIIISITASQSPSSHRRSQVIFKVRCPACDRILDHELSDCPWCEASLAGAEALIYHAEEKQKAEREQGEIVDDSASN
jgi:hypothetical protein